MNFSSQECKPLVILHLGYIDYPSYVAVVRFHNLNLPKGIQISDIDFQVRLYIWTVISFCATNLYTSVT